MVKPHIILVLCISQTFTLFLMDCESVVPKLMAEKRVQELAKEFQSKLSPDALNRMLLYSVYWGKHINLSRILLNTEADIPIR